MEQRLSYIRDFTVIQTLNHPDELAPGRISSGWHMANARLVKAIYDLTLNKLQQNLF